MEFAYALECLEDAGAPALSCALPKRVELFGRRECQAFFGGTLPEEGQRSAIAKVLGVGCDQQ